jgi:ferredoxin
MDMEVSPYENVAEIIEGVQAWGVLDCICRKQKLLIDEPCDHPIDVCMMLSKRPGAFDSSSTVQSVTQEEALATLQRAADAGLVHSVTNSQDGVWYICNCCTCSCGILRGMVDLGLANVVARSAFVNQVEDALCTGCEICLETCQFDALSMAETAVVDTSRCVGCGVCVHSCPDEALILIRRPEAEIKPPPVTEEKWLEARAAARGLAPWEQRLKG